MDPKLIFWTGAFANMSLIVALAFVGVRARRRGDIALHVRCMLTGAVLVAAFLLAYVWKLAFLGREDMDAWSGASVWVLRIHETCVLVMLVAGALAVRRGRALRATRNVTRDPADPAAPLQQVRGHRGAGQLAVGAAVLGLLTAGVVLFGMYQRAGLP